MDVESIAVASMLSFQSACINGSEFDAPQSDRFTADSDSKLSQQFFDMPMAKVEPVVQPNGVTDDIWRESVSFICIHPSILSISVS